MDRKARIAHLAGPNATIQNTPPLVTSNKARAKHNLPLLVNPDSTPSRFDVLRPQRLAAPVTVYVEQFSGHPLEADAAELYGPPDGYVDSAGRVHKERQSAGDKPVYEVELRPIVFCRLPAIRRACRPSTAPMPVWARSHRSVAASISSPTSRRTSRHPHRDTLWPE